MNNLSIVQEAAIGVQSHPDAIILTRGVCVRFPIDGQPHYSVFGSGFRLGDFPTFADAFDYAAARCV